MIQEEQPSTINCSTTITIDEKSGQLIKNVKTEMRIKAMTELFDEMLASVSNSDNDSDDEDQEGMTMEKDESLSTEVPSFANSIQNAEIATPPTKKRKSKSRRGNKRTIKPAEFKIEISCSNYNCTHIKAPNSKKWYKLKFPDADQNPKYYCSSCSRSIKKKWCCQFCNGIYTDPSHSKGADMLEWIQCDSSKCKRWTHIECEKRHGTVIKALDNSSFKYYCPSCREQGKKNNTKMRNDYSRLRSSMKNAKKSKNKKIVELKKTKEQSFGFRAFRRKEETSPEVTYVYSENYQTIGKLLKQKGYSLSITNREMMDDFCLKGK